MLRQVRLFNKAAPARTVERGIQSELNPVGSIVIPTSVYCSPGGECYHTSRKLRRVAERADECD